MTILSKVWVRFGVNKQDSDLLIASHEQKDKRNRKNSDEEAFVFVHFSMYDSAIHNKNDDV